MRTLIGVGTPRGLQGRLTAAVAVILALRTLAIDMWRDRSVDLPIIRPDSRHIIGSICYLSSPFSHGLLGD